MRAQADPATALRTVSLFSFFQGASGDGFGDPHCIYHAPSGRFFAVAYQTTSTLATFVPLAMSPVNDPVREIGNGRETRKRDQERERETGR